MPLDPSIYGQIDTQAPNRLAQMFDPAVIQQRQLQADQMQNQQNQLARANKLQQLLGTAGSADPAQLSSVLAKNGFADEAVKYQGLADAQQQRKDAEAARRQDMTRKVFGNIAAEGGDANAVRKHLSQLPWVPADQVEAAAAAADQIPPEQRQDHFLGLADPNYLAKRKEAEAARIERGEQLAADRKAREEGRLPDGMRMGPKGPEWVPGYIEGKARIAAAGANAGGVPMTIVQTENGPIQVPTRGVGPSRAVLDPTTGQPVKAPATGSTGVPAEVKRQIGGVVQLNADLDALKTAMQDYDPRSTDIANTQKRAKIQSIAKQAQLSAKEAAALGALSGPDMGLLEGILADPTSPKGVLIGRGGILEQINQAQLGNKRRIESLGKQYGAKATDGLDLGNQPPPAQQPSSPVATPSKSASSGFKYLGKEK